MRMDNFPEQEIIFRVSIQISEVHAIHLIHFNANIYLHKEWV